MKIAIDIGHAHATGSSGNGLQEHEVCAGFARLLADYLCNKHEVRVVDFPSQSNYADLRSTVQEVNAWGADLCISLHCDAHANTAARGAHCIYTSAAGEKYAEAIAKHLCPIMPGRANRTVKRGSLYILNNTRCPAVLVECGFLSNARDADMLRHEGYRLMRAVAAGVLDVAPA